MAPRRKHRTHVKTTNTAEAGSEDIPKSFIIKHGQVGTSLTQLVRDLRKVMEPNTATRLKVCARSFFMTAIREGLLDYRSENETS